MRIDIATLFPEMCESVLNESIIGRARRAGKLEVFCHNIRDYTLDKHRRVDDTPYGGGKGMLMQTEPIYRCWQAVCEMIGTKPHVIYMSPKGQPFSQKRAGELRELEHIFILCGHYEGVDERVLEEIVTDYVSIGDYVLTGGELPAMVMVDAISRMVPGVLTNEESGSTESLEGGLLEYPQYSRPANWNGKEVPQVLLSGDHKKIESWRHEQSVQRTLRNRPELLEEAELSRADVKQILKQLKK